MMSMAVPVPMPMPMPLPRLVLVLVLVMMPVILLPSTPSPLVDASLHRAVGRPRGRPNVVILEFM